MSTGESFLDADGPPQDAAPRRSRCALFLLVDCCLVELKFAWTESLSLMFDFLVHMPGAARIVSLPPEERLKHPCLRWNPIWWGGVIGCVVCMVPGHLFHMMFGQGGPVRQDELVAEKKARIGWVYTYSGGFCFTALMDLVTFLTSFSKEDPEERQKAVESSLVAVLMSLWYSGGDCNLLFQMRKKNTVFVHAAAIGRITYGVAFILAFIIGLLSAAGRAAMTAWVHGGKDLPAEQEVTAMSWILRLCFSLFMVIAVLGYKPLLQTHYDEEATLLGTYKLKVVCLTGSVFTVILGFIFILAHAYAQQAFGQPKAWPRIIFAMIVLPSLVYAVAYFMEGFCPTRTTCFAALVAMLPFIIVGSAFTIGGPDLWTMLSGG